MVLTILEAAKILRYEYEMEFSGKKVDEDIVEQWVNEGQIKSSRSGTSITINEDDLYNFVEASRLEGTPYEIGISDQVKIERLFDEINKLKEENENLIVQNRECALKLGIDLF